MSTNVGATCSITCPDLNKLITAIATMTGEVKNLGEKLTAHYDTNKDDHTDLWNGHKELWIEFKTMQTEIASCRENKHKQDGAFTVIKLVGGIAISISMAIAGWLYAKVEASMLYQAKEEQQMVDIQGQIHGLQELVGIISAGGKK